MTLHRRNFLKFGALACGGAAGFGRAAAVASLPSAADCRLVLRNVHTGEEVDLAYRSGGAPVPAAMTRIEWVLRDFRTGASHAMDPALLDYLSAAAAVLGAEPVFSVISGYRSPQTNAMLHEHSSGVAVRSLHMEGRAIDVRLAGVACTDLAAQAVGLARGGVGFYRTSDFVHLDTGAFRTWRG